MTGHMHGWSAMVEDIEVEHNKYSAYETDIQGSIYIALANSFLDSPTQQN